VILLAVKVIQDGGILRSANTTKIIGISAMIPLILIGVVRCSRRHRQGELFSAGTARP